jgi:hypothetical protein
MHIVLTFILSVGASIIGTVIYLRLSEHRKNQPLNRILNFGPDDELIFVFTHRDHVPESILPRTSTEDFMAMNNFISALIKVGWKKKIAVRDTLRLTEQDKQKNLVLICSAKSNIVTKEVQDMLLENKIRCYFNAQKPNTNQWHIKDLVMGNFPSKTYNEIHDYLDSGGEPHELASQELNDVAVITKVTNPWNAINKIFIVAGVRGIGTWGAAECIKKEWRDIYDTLPKNKSSDFSALVTIKYKNCDILSSKLHSLIPIKHEPVC